MTLSIATVSVSGQLDEKLTAIAAAGFDGVEIFENDFIGFDMSPAALGRAVREAGLDITLFQPFRDFEGMPEPARQKAFDRAERKFDVMGELGCDLILVCSNISPQALGGIDRAAADLRELGERAAKRGLRVGYEALAWGRHVSDHRDAWEIVRRADHPAVGIILDSFHTLAKGVDPASIRSIPRDKIFLVQLADAPRIDMDLLYWSRHFRNMPGQGDLNVLGFTQAVAATGYDGVWSLEIFNDQFRSAPPRLIAQDGKRALLALLDDVRLNEPEATVAPALPPRVPVRGTSFIEFTANDAEARRLDGVLRALGFAQVACHQTDRIAVYAQGGIRLIVNSEPNGLAQASRVMHGTSVCGIGFAVDDPHAARQRALLMGAAPLEQDDAAARLDLPAVRDMGGGVLYFTDAAAPFLDTLGTPFEAVADGGRPAGLTAIDHIAQTTRYEELLSWSLFYTSLFDLDRSSLVDVPDPNGLVRSLALTGGSDGTPPFRLTLNGAEHHRTLAGRFISETFGAAVQHIAFATDDIVATAKALRDNGVELLDVPANYYDDIDARFDLDPALLDRLREHNIFYDRNGEAAMLHLYSRTSPDGSFFEIVERQGGYEGHSAANAPFRIAAQKRRMRPAAVPRA